MKAYEILQHKGDTVYSISPNATLAEVVEKLVKHNIGSLLVMDGDRLAGIITERDILRACAGDERPLGEIQVFDRMTTNLCTATSQEEVGNVMGLLTANRIRHLPIVDEAQLVGIISIGDVVKAQHDELTLENHFLKRYIQS